jgi:hypothetical protein
MPNLIESSQWDAGVYEFQTTDPIQGGPGGIDNEPHQNLVNRVLWLRNRLAAAITQAGLVDGTADNTQLAQAVVLHVSNIAALLALPVPIVPVGRNIRVFVAGYNVDGDGIGQFYEWVSPSTAPGDPSGYSPLVPNSNPAEGRWFAVPVNAANLQGNAASYFATAAGLAAEASTRNAQIINAINTGISYTNSGVANEGSIRAAADTALSTAISTEAENRQLEIVNAIETAEGYTDSSVSSEAATRVATMAAEAAARVAGDAATLAAAENYALGTSNLAGGWTKLPAGMIIQGGVAAAQAGAPGTTIGFGKPFPNACISVVVTAYGQVATVAVLSWNKNGFQGINGVGGDLSYFAIGY